METKMITIPFDVELAKKIQIGTKPGKIVTRDGWDVRIVCWDFKFEGLPIIALTSCENGEEQHGAYSKDGCSLVGFIERPANTLCDDEMLIPTLYQAQKWLRKEKGIYVWVEPVIGRKWSLSYCDFNVSSEESDWMERELHKDGYPVYEALDTGILEALKLI